MDDSSAGSRMVASYLVRDGRVAPVRRLVGSGRPELGPVLEQLLAGPTPEELAAGYTSAIPPGVQLLGIEGERTDTVTVDLSGQLGTVGTPLSAQLALGQLVHTVVHELGPAVSVVVQLDGQPLTAPGRRPGRRPADGRRRRGRHAARGRAVAAAGRHGPLPAAGRPAPRTPSRPRACWASPRPPTSCRRATRRSSPRRAATGRAAPST